MLFDWSVIFFICIEILMLGILIYEICKKNEYQIAIWGIYLVVYGGVLFGLCFPTHYIKKEVSDSYYLSISKTTCKTVVEFPDNSIGILDGVNKDIKIEKVVRYNVYNMKSIIYRVKDEL